MSVSGLGGFLMNQLRGLRPSPSMLVAILALVVAASGTAVAASGLVSGDKIISKGTLSGNRLRNHSITGTQVNLRKLGKVPTATKADSAITAKNATNATTAATANIANHLPTVTFTALSLQNGWVTGPASFGPPRFTKDAEGFVHLSGAIDGSAKTSSLIAVLPAGFRPTTSPQIWLRAASTNGANDPHLVDIGIEQTDGDVLAFPATGSTSKFVSLEGLTFYAG